MVMTNNDTQVYGNYKIMVHSLRLPGGEFSNKFSIYLIEANEPKQRTTVFQAPESESPRFQTEEEALENGVHRAKAWIDANCPE
jgi:hypothetical protein